MTNFEINTSASGLADALNANGGDSYFDSITTEPSEESGIRYTKLTKSGTDILILERLGNSDSLQINGVDLTSYDYYTPPSRKYTLGYVTDNAIILFADGDFKRPLIFCKTKKGYTCIITPIWAGNNSGGMFEVVSWFNNNNTKIAKTYAISISSTGEKSE